MCVLLLWFPLLNFLIGLCFGSFLTIGFVYFCIFNMGIVVLIVLNLLIHNFSINTNTFLDLGLWFEVGSLEVRWSIFCDNISLFMCLIITFISFIVHLYSSEYMKEDPHLIRFMSYLSFFTFCMLILVLADNLVQMFVGWEGVGVASYLLINFWSTRIQANKAAIKAMLFNRVADACLLLGLFSCYIVFETFDYSVIASLVYEYRLYTFNFFNFNINVVEFICLFLFLGAMGKSAQLGFHNWLPDAMEGPTPVSALIHAATMVTAGVFLLIRCSFLFIYAPNVLFFISIVGALTALFGATSGLYAHDLKRVIAFSTCSQLGYMFIACGYSKFTIAFFHLITHAFFKALLFLAAGAIIHSLFDEQDVRKMGGLGRKMPLTSICFLIGSVNLMGLPFFSGFFSKDILLELILIDGTSRSLFCYCIGVFVAFLTSLYSTRLYLLIFCVKLNYSTQKANSIHEPKIRILGSLLLLSFLSIFVGYWFSDIFNGVGSTFFSGEIFYLRNNYNLFDIELLTNFQKSYPIIAVFFGIYTANFLYNTEPFFFFSIKQTKIFKNLYLFFLKKWFFDRIVNELLVISFLNFCISYPYFSLDRGLLELFGPSNLKNSVNNITKFKSLSDNQLFSSIFI